MKMVILLSLFVLLSISVVSAIQISSEDFETNSFSGGTGWNDIWTTGGGCQISSLSNPIGNYQMRAISSCIATRYFDNSQYNNVQVTFYAGASSLENSDHCYYSYYDGTSYQQLLQLDNGDDDGVLRYYSFNVTATSPTAGFVVQTSSSQSGDYCLLDNILINGEELTPELGLYSQLQYQRDSQMVVDLTSSLTNTLHQFEVFESNDTLICNETLTSPSVPNTVYQGICQLPDVVQNNAYIKYYTIGANVTKSFNIVGSQNDPTQLDIDRVYFSQQVLQGGSTEIFAILDTNLTIDNIFVTITFPDNSTRKLSMEETSNQNEYRAFITDTFQTGNTTFEITAQSGVYYDTYMNTYFVAPYNVDFVNTVNNVNKILSQPPSVTVAGTDYFSGENGMTFLQLSDEGKPVNNATCKLSIYYPNITMWVDDQAMIQGDAGLQYYPFVAPEDEGIYMVSAFCEYFRVETWFFDLIGDADYPHRTIIEADSVVGNELNLNSHLDNGYEQSNAYRQGGTYTVELNYNFTHDIITNVTNPVLYWMGESNEEPTLEFYWYNWTSASYQLLPNSITLSATVNSQALQPSGVGEFLSNDLPDEAMNNGTIMIKVKSISNKDFDLWNNWLNIQSSNLEGTSPQFLRGGGEIHISNSADVIVNALNGIKNDTTNILNDTSYIKGQNTEIIRILQEMNVTISYINGTSIDINNTVLDISNHLYNIDGDIITIQDYLDYINQTTYEINQTVNNIYDILLNVDLILDEINYTINNLNLTIDTSNLTATVDLSSIEQDLIGLREEIDYSNEFNKESVFLITDSIVSTQQAQASDDKDEIINELLVVETNLKQLKSNDTKTNYNFILLGGGLLFFVLVLFIFYRYYYRNVRKVSEYTDVKEGIK